MNIIAHIVGLDEIHKKNLIKQLPSNIKTIDLDHIQQIIYNSDNITLQKQLWAKLTNDINIKQKQKKLIMTQGADPTNIDAQIKKLMAKRNATKQEIHQIWKDKMLEEIDSKLLSYNKYQIIFIGFNIYPKDYRIKINIPIPLQSNNKIFFDIDAGLYASNQIKYHLRTYTDKIIRGDFPINLLKHDYLESKYDKFIQYYTNLGYIGITSDELYNTIIELSTQITNVENLSNDKIYVATLYKSGDIIPVNSKTPIQGFTSKNDAIDNIRPKIKNNAPIYIYEINPNQFRMFGGKLMATQELYPLNEESCLLTI